MTEYDPNLPQEFAHMPKRRGLGPALVLLAIVVVFALAALLGTLRHQAPITSGPASTDLRPPSDAGLPPPPDK